MSEKLGFIGLGIMGGGMAANLLRAGHRVTVWNRTASRMDPLVEMGASAAGSPREVAEQSTVVMICVSDTPDVVAVTEGSDGILAGLAAGSLVVDHSTISPSETRRLAGLAEVAGAGWLDGPVSGGSEGADSAPCRSWWAARPLIWRGCGLISRRWAKASPTPVRWDRARW